MIRRLLQLAVGVSTWHAASASAAAAQDVIVAGIVRTRGGTPVRGAHVRAVIGRAETLSGPAGDFRLRLRPGPGGPRVDTIRVERIGFAGRKIVTELRDSVVRMDVELSEVAIRLDEMVVTATAGTQTRRAQAGVVATVPVAELEEVMALATLPNALQARVTSLDVTPSSGSSGEAQRIWLRGATSLALSNEPLVFVDGIRADSRLQRLRPDVGGQSSSRLFDIDPADIERVEIVKGPAASATYGAEASAGVIQIFTRRGAVGRERLSQRVSVEAGSIGASWSPPENFARCGAADVEPSSPALLCHGLAEGTIVSDNPLRRAGVLRAGRTRELRWSADGGGSTFGVYAAGSTSREAGTLPQNGFDRHSLRFNSRWTPTPSLRLEGRFGFVKTRTAHPQNGDNPDFGLLLAGTLGNPLTIGTRNDGAFGAPVHALTSVEQILHVTRAIPTVEIAYDRGERLHQRLIAGLDVSNSVGRFFVPLRHDNAFTGGAAQGIVRADHEMYQVLSVDYLGTVRLFDDARRSLSGKASVGAQYVETSDELVIAAGSGLVSNVADRVADAASRTGMARSFLIRSVGTFAQAELGFRNRVFVQAGARADGHSAFGSRAGPQWFPKVGASWVVADGDRYQSHVPGVHTLRVRAAYGTSGRAPFQGQSGATYVAAPAMVGPSAIVQGLAPASPGNPKLRPERATELELGADAGFLRDRLALEVTYFDKRSKDLLYSIPQPPSLGFPADPLGNVAARIRNYGLEATARWNGEIGTRQVSTQLGSSTLKNVAPFERDRPLGAMYDYRVVRIDSAAGQVIVTDSAEFVGPSMPARTVFWGATVEVARGVRLHVAVDGKWGYWQHNMDADVRDRYVRNSERAVRAAEMSAAERLTRFGPFVTESGTRVSAVLGPYLQDASFVRWRELSVTWDAPRRLAQRVGGRSASVTVAARNLHLWTRYEGDPEVVSMISENANGGTVQFAQPTFLTMPQARRWSTRVTVSF